MQERKDNPGKLILIIGVISFLIFNLLAFFCIREIMVPRGEEVSSILYAIIIIIIILINCFIICVTYSFFKMIKKKEKSINMLKSKLSSDKYVEVIPTTEVSARYYYFIKVELPSVAKFFAILNEEGTGARIMVKFNEYEKYHFFEYVRAEEFISRYKIKKENA